MWHEVLLHIYKQRTTDLTWFLTKIGQLPIRKWRNNTHASLVIVCDLIGDIRPTEYMWSMFDQYMRREYGFLNIHITTLLEPLIINLINRRGSLPSCLQRYIDYEVLAAMLVSCQDIDTMSVMCYSLLNPSLITAIIKVVGSSFHVNIIQYLDYFKIAHTLLHSSTTADMSWQKTFTLFWYASRSLSQHHEIKKLAFFG